MRFIDEVDELLVVTRSHEAPQFPGDIDRMIAWLEIVDTGGTGDTDRMAAWSEVFDAGAHVLQAGQRPRRL